MKNFLLLITLCIIAISANAQPKAKTVSNHSLSIYTVGASYNYEQTLGGKMTIIAHAGLLMSHMVWSMAGFEYSINPGLGLEARYYYNLDRRKSRGKNTDYNSANYLSLDQYFMFKPVTSQNMSKTSGYLVAPHWGIRRVYNDRWLLEFNLGIRCFVESKSVTLAPRLNLKFGIVF